MRRLNQEFAAPKTAKAIVLDGRFYLHPGFAYGNLPSATHASGFPEQSLDMYEILLGEVLSMSVCPSNRVSKAAPLGELSTFALLI
jgi:hypothetical protein